MKNATKILWMMTLLMPIPLACHAPSDDVAAFEAVEPWQADEPLEDEPRNEIVGVASDEPGSLNVSTIQLDAPRDLVLTCATAAFGTHSTAYVVEFEGDGNALVKRGPSHGYREWLDSPEAPTRGPIDEHELPFVGSVSEESIDLDVALFDLALEATHPGYFRGEAYIADHGPEDIECWTPDFTPPFRYDGDTGECRDNSGATGLNQTGVVLLRETKFGECADLSGTELNEMDYRYPVFLEMNLAGADLEGARFHFAGLEEADLRGTKMETLEFGYAWLTGELDEHTRVIDRCRKSETELECGA